VGQLGNSCFGRRLRHNERHIKKDKVGFYGLDVYSLWSFDEVLKYLENKDLTIKRPP
jgi:hypothetical protein